MAKKETALTEQRNEIDHIKKDVVDVVENRVESFIQNGELNLPPNYSPHNAMKAAWLQLQTIEDKDGNWVLKSCTRSSIANALLDMVVQGLNPAKKQCYFIAYKNKLVCQRSYFGTMAVCKNVTGAIDVAANVVYEDDEFVYEIIRSRKVVRRHIQKLENIKPEKIKAAYCIIEFGDGREHCDVMTIADIKKAWQKSKMDPNKDGSVHKTFPEEMCKRTIINRTCKAYINSSNDSNLLIEHFNRTEDVIDDQEIEDEIADNANSEVIDIEEYNVENGDEQESSNKTEQTKSSVDRGEQQVIGGGPGF